MSKLFVNLIQQNFTGFGDACYQTQLFAIFGSVYADKSAAAFAIFKFTQSAASAIAFFSSSYMGIFAQMLTLLTTAILGFLGIFIVELDTRKKLKITDSATSSRKESIERVHHAKLDTLDTEQGSA